MDEGRIAFDLARLVDRELREARRPSSIQKGTRVLISLWDSLMFGRVLSRVLMLVLVQAFCYSTWFTLHLPPDTSVLGARATRPRNSGTGARPKPAARASASTTARDQPQP